MENSNQNNEEVSYELVHDSDNDHNIIILKENPDEDEKQVDKKVGQDSPNKRSNVNKKKSPKRISSKNVAYRKKISTRNVSSPKRISSKNVAHRHKLSSKNVSSPKNISSKKVSSPRKKHRHEEEGQISPRKKESAKRFQRKNAKKATVHNRIRVVGKVCAKLSSLIERLQQNTISSKNKVNNHYEGNKVVMAPRIKAALEKFNKKAQDPSQIVHYVRPYKRFYFPNDDLSSKGEREDTSTVNYEEEEYEEDEEYEDDEEEEDEEEEEEEEKGLQRNHQPSIKKRKIKKDISNDGDSNSGISGKRKKKRRRRKRRDVSGEEEDENDDEVEFEYDENGKRRRKRKRKKRRRNNNDIIEEEESGEYEDSEEEEEDGDEDDNTIDKKTGKKIRKNNTNDISDNKSSDKGKNISTRRKRGVSTHKSGKGKTIVRNKNKNDPSNDDTNDNKDDNFPVVRNKKRGISTHKSGRGKIMVRNKDKDDLKNKDNDNNNDVFNIKRTLSKHKSGRGKTIIRNNNKNNDGAIIFSDDEEDSDNSDNDKDKVNDIDSDSENDSIKISVSEKSDFSSEFSKDKDKDKDKNKNKDKDSHVNGDTIFNKKRGICRHNSGQGKTIVKRRRGKYNTVQMGPVHDKIEKISKEQEEFLIRNFGAFKKGSFLLVRKVPIKVVNFERFPQNHYTITNYKSKVNGQRIMKELIKYIPCKQTDFILYAAYDPEYEEFIKNGGRIIKRKAISSTIRKNKLIKKPLNLNRPIKKNKESSNNINDIKNNNTNGSDNNNAYNNHLEGPDKLKSFLKKMSNKNLNNENIEKRLYDIEKMKNSLKNEMNEQLNKKRRRHQSIILTNGIDFNDIPNKNNYTYKKTSDKGLLKNMKFTGNKYKDNINKEKNPKMKLEKIVRKRHLNMTIQYGSNKVLNFDSDKFGIKKVKFDLLKSKKPQLNNKNQDEIKEEEEVQINDDGVKYLVFELRSDLKMIYRKAKWKLARSNRISIFLKAVKPNKYQNSPKKKNNKVFINVDENEKNDDFPIYKRKGDNYKLVKDSLKKNNINNNKYMFHTENNISITSEESEEKNKSQESRNTKGKDASNTQLYYDLFKTYESEKKDNDLFKSINSNSNSYDERDKYMTNKNKNSRQKENLDDYLRNHYNRIVKKRFYTRPKRMPRNKDYELLEENSKIISKVKSKKAKIKQFKARKDNLEDDNNNKRIRGFLYDYIHNKQNRLLYISNTIKKNMRSHAHLNKSEDTRNRNNNENYFNYDTSSKTNFSDARGSRKQSKILSANKNNKKLKKIKNESESNKNKNSVNNNNATINYNYSKFYNNNNNNINSVKNEKSKNMTIINYPNSRTTKKRKITEDTNDSKLSIPKVNKSQNKIPRKLGYDSYFKKNNNPNIKNDSKNFHTISMPAIPKQNYKKKKVNFSREQTGIDAVKSKFKIKLIEINDDLLDAIHYYNGPIDISCISSKNYIETVEGLNKKVLKNGFKCIKNEKNYFKFSNGKTSFLVEIVKIRNNMLYYLVLKNQ